MVVIAHWPDSKEFSSAFKVRSLFFNFEAFPF